MSQDEIKTKLRRFFYRCEPSSKTWCRVKLLQFKQTLERSAATKIFISSNPTEKLRFSKGKSQADGARIKYKSKCSREEKGKEIARDGLGKLRMHMNKRKTFLPIWDLIHDS